MFGMTHRTCTSASVHFVPTMTTLSTPLPLEPSTDSPLLTARLASSVAALPGFARLSGLVQPYLESYAVPDRVANLELYARSRASALNEVPAVAAMATRAAHVIEKIQETKAVVSNRVSAVSEHVSAAKATVAHVATTTSTNVALSTNAALSALQARKAHAVETAHTTAASLVHTIVSHPLGVQVSAAALLAETKLCGAIAFASDVSEVALDRVLAPEADEAAPVEDEGTAEAPEHIGQPTAETLARLRDLALKARHRIASKTTRTVTTLKDSTTQSVDALRQRLVWHFSASLSSLKSSRPCLAPPLPLMPLPPRLSPLLVSPSPP